MLSTTLGTKTLTYQYDAAGNRTQLTWPETSFYVTTTFDALNRPTAIKELGTTPLATYAYDDLSRRTTVTLGNGTTTSYGYSPEGTLASLGHDLAGTAQDQSYTYTRNPLREIASHSWSNDLYQWAGAANGTQSYTANGLNQYTAAAGSTLSYDTKGNLSGDGVWTYTYDVDNRLKTAAKTGYSATLSYDAEGRLHATVLGGVTTNLRYDGTELVAEYNSSGGLLRRYVHGPGVDEPLVWYEGTGTTNKTWLYADQLGSVVGTANSAGTSTAIYSYGPFGEPNVTTGVRFRYTGQQYLGGLNLYYYKARFYSPALGRFLQTDPIGTRDDLNLYAYVGNNPVNRADPTGLSSDDAQDFANPFATDWSQGVLVAAGGGRSRVTTGGSAAAEINQAGVNLRYNDALRQIQVLNPNFQAPATIGPPGSGRSEAEVRYLESVLQARQRYPKEPQRMENHHVTPQYLGGPRNGPTVPLDAAHHEVITQQMRQEMPFRQPQPINQQQVQDFLRNFYQRYPLPPSEGGR
ncbi:hypothetical protein GRF61_14090 [Azoarcus sp. TTM-91]|nr:hypothetical protein [Azoarcus sp. TTM-91]